MTYEAIVKVDPADEPAKRAHDIEAGIGYACALLRDEYGRTTDDIDALLERVQEDA